MTVSPIYQTIPAGPHGGQLRVRRSPGSNFSTVTREDGKPLGTLYIEERVRSVLAIPAGGDSPKRFPNVRQAAAALDLLWLLVEASGKGQGPRS